MKLLSPLNADTQGKLIQQMSGLQSGGSSLPRSYHNMEHLHSMQSRVIDMGCNADDFIAMHLAIWFHDLYYNSQAPKGENEDRSCELVDRWFVQQADLRVLAEKDQRLTERVKLYIQRTKTHEMLPTDDQPSNTVLNPVALARFLRADLDVFTQHPRRYWQYLIKLRMEYAWADDTQWRKGRITFLEGMLSKPEILPIATNEANEARSYALHADARANLTTELTLLRENKSYLQWQL